MKKVIALILAVLFLLPSGVTVRAMGAQAHGLPMEKTEAAAGSEGSVLLEEDFEQQALPNTWDVERTNANSTWRAYQYAGSWCAYCSDDWQGEGRQDERLITPALPLNGQEAEVSFLFTGGKYPIQEGSFVCSLEGSVDGATWTRLWSSANETDYIADGDYRLAAQVHVSVPAALQTDTTRFAFRYERPAGDATAPCAIDNVQVTTAGVVSPPIAETYTIAAFAGEGGTIEPSGAVSVVKGQNQTFIMKADQGYAVARLEVDGVEVDADSSYTFENVTGDHTISVAFTQVQEQLPDSIYENFDQGVLPNGWSVEGPSADYHYETWKVERYDALNSNAAVCSQNIMFRQVQDEKLILPRLNPANNASLCFDFGGSYAELAGGSLRLTVVASQDQGATWTELWNAADHLPHMEEGDEPEEITGKAEVQIPAEFCNPGTVFAFAFQSEDRRNGSAAVDNVELSGTGAPTPVRYAVTVAELEHGSVVPDKTTAAAGETVTLAVTPDIGYRLKENSLLANGAVIRDNTFTMPDRDVTVTAVFEEESSEAGEYRDGTYRGTAQGRNGAVTVDVTVRDGKIAEVEVVSQEETPSYWERALAMIERLLGLSKEEDISGADTVTGATISSRAIQNAVLNALEQAKTPVDSGIFDSGSGTAQDPYIIMTMEQLCALAAQVNQGKTYAGVYVALGTSLNAEGFTWVPIGRSDQGKPIGFQGTFDGRNYAVRNLTCGTAEEPASFEAMGFFGVLGQGGVVRNLNVTITKYYHTQDARSETAAIGGIAGVLGADAVIDHCSVTGGDQGISGVSQGESAYCAGGLAGVMEAGSVIANSWTDVGISSGSLELSALTAHYAGGICGRQAANSLIANCAGFALVGVTVATGEIHVGGLVGETAGALYNCYSMSSTRGNNLIDGGTTAVGMLAGNSVGGKALYQCHYNKEANQVIDFSDQSGDPSEGKEERRKVVGYDSVTEIQTDLTYVYGLEQAELAKAAFTATMNSGLKNSVKSAASAYLTEGKLLERSIPALEDMLEAGFVSWELAGSRVLPEGSQREEAVQIVSVALLEARTVAFGTEVDALDLPQTVQATLNDGSTSKFQVVWQCDTYDPRQVGDYTFCGTLILPDGVHNPDNRMAYLVITVLEEPASEVYTVTVIDGIAGRTSAKAGETVQVAAVNKPGHTFQQWIVLSGSVWLKDGDCSVTSFVMPAEHVTLQAAYAINQYTVRFVGFDGAELSVQTVEHGKPAVLPDAPIWEGHTFAGWSGDVSCVTGDMTVTALYTTNPCTVFFVDWDGTVLDVQTVLYGGGAKAPTAPERAGYRFTGWSSDFSRVTASTIVRAQYAAVLPFTDVSERAWYYSAVLWAYENGVMNGVNATTFAPDGSTTRAQFVTMLFRISGEVGPKGNGGFTDVPVNSYYAAAAAWAAEHEIVRGVGASRFAPNEKVTREQIVTILYRYAQYKGLQVPANPMALAAFPDGSAVSGWAREAMAWAIDAGLIQGISGRLAPAAYATRAQCATILMRFAENDAMK